MAYTICEWDSVTSTQIDRKATTEEAAEFDAAKAASLLPVVPQTLTSFQAKAALANAGLYIAVNTYMTTTASLIDQIAWIEATIFERSSPTIARLAVLLNLSSAQIDALFIAGDLLTP